MDVADYVTAKLLVFYIYLEETLAITKYKIRVAMAFTKIAGKHLQDWTKFERIRYPLEL